MRFQPVPVGCHRLLRKGQDGRYQQAIHRCYSVPRLRSNLSEIKRFYVQGGKVIANPEPKTAGIKGNSITQEWCDAENAANKEEVYPFKEHGGMKSMAAGMAKGMVLVMSLWDDHYANMLWLDSTYPTDAAANAPGAARGDCPTSSGEPADVEKNNANAQVKYYNIKFGPIGSTFKQPSGT